MKNLKINIFGHSIDVFGVANDFFHLLLLTLGLAGINVEKYINLGNQALVYVQGDFSILHGLGWGTLAILVARVIFQANATFIGAASPVDLQTVTAISIPDKPAAIESADPSETGEAAKG